MKQALLIVNPYSTNVTGRSISDVETALRERLDVRTEFTRAPAHATELAAEAEGSVDAILVFSGDGTYNEALNGIDGAVPFGFLPGGGTSVLPRALGLPRDPVAAARRVADALADGEMRTISLGRVNGRRFCFSAGIGFDAEAVRRLNSLGRAPGGARPGDSAFAWMIARMLVEHRGRWEPQLEIDELGRAAFLIVANGDPYSYAGRIPMRPTPNARFELGLDLVAPRRVRARDVPRLLNGAFRGAGDNEALITMHDVDRVEVRCDHALPLQADGEDLGDVEAAVFEAERDALAVLV